jgi:hypothetical protein
MFWNCQLSGRRLNDEVLGEKRTWDYWLRCVGDLDVRLEPNPHMVGEWECEFCPLKPFMAVRAWLIQVVLYRCPKRNGARSN